MKLPITRTAYGYTNTTSPSIMLLVDNDGEFAEVKLKDGCTVKIDIDEDQCIDDNDSFAMGFFAGILFSNRNK